MMKTRLPFALLILCTVLANAFAWGQPAAYPPPKFGDTSSLGRNVQRSMRLLATSTPQKRNTVRVLFYGQSITEQKWWQAVAGDLRSRFPHANLVIENRALGGFASQLLVKTAETDLYSFYPDLLIFQVYGAHDKYDDIIRRVREQTTAEILQQNDHVTNPAAFSEETDPAKLWPPNGKQWDAFMNHNWLPAVSKRYSTEFCDQRGFWKQYLTDNGLQPKQLLIDGVHLNAHGEFLMSKCVEAYLRYDPRLGPAAADSWVKTYEVGKDVAWRDGVLCVPLVGNRVDVIVKPGAAPPAAVKIDGHKPSAFPELYGFTRTRAAPGGKWPPIAPLHWQKPLVLEDWTMDVVKDRLEPPVYRFTLRGSKTGPDGEGRSEARFVSRSGRIVIEPDDWGVAFALMLAGVKPVPDRFTVTWSVVPRFVDEFVSPGIKDPAIETTVTLAQGLANGKHVLEIAGDEKTPIAAIRVYCPPLKAK